MSANASVTVLTPRAEGVDLPDGVEPRVTPFLVDLRVGDDDVGEVVDHVANAKYVSWLDRAAELHADALGYTRRWLLDEGLMWFVARHEIDYLAEVWRGDELVVATWVRPMRRVKCWREYAILRPSDRHVVCRACTLWVLVDLATRRPLRIPREMALRFEAPASAAPRLARKV